MVTAAKTCSQSEFACGTNGTCIPVKWRCDKELDCEHGEDEKYCEAEPTACSATQFFCAADKKCIDNNLKCDEVDDCSDGSDEEKHCKVTFSPPLIGHCACSDPLRTAIKVKARVQVPFDTAECYFEAVLRDTIAPVFTSCPRDIFVMDFEVPLWSDPVYYDNVGVVRKQCPDARYRQPLAAGNYSVSYVVWDYEMNEGRCDFNIYVSSPDMPLEQLPQGQRERLSRIPETDVGLIVRVSVGALILVAVILADVFVCKRRQRLNNQQTAAHARRLPRDLRTGFSHGIYAIPCDIDVKLPPYTPSKSPPPYDHPDYIKAGFVDGKDTLSQPPPYYINPGYETMSSVRKDSVEDENVSVKSDKVKSEKADE